MPSFGIEPQSLLAILSLALGQPNPSAPCFQVLSERAFGKLKETYQHEVNPLRDVSEEELHQRIRGLELELGVTPNHLQNVCL